jgi:two-component system, NarL family, invasion response regulator UvrY
LKKVLVADDHAIVRKGIEQIIAELDDVVVEDEAKDGHEALEKAACKEYDLVLLDVSMPGRDGLDVLKELKRRRPRLPVIMLSMHPEEQYAVRALRSGASGYLAKDSAPDELIDAIRKALAGCVYMSASLAEKLAAGTADLSGRRPHEQLSDREYQIMRMLASGKTLGSIAHDLSLSVKTISTYRARILLKLNLHGNADVARYVLEHELG